MFKKIIFILFYLSITSNAHALTYYNFVYRIEEGESFSLILRKFVKDFSVINAKTPLVKKIIMNNPQIKKWNDLHGDKAIELFISEDFLDISKYRRYEANTLQKIAKNEELKKEQIYPTGLKGSVFYMGSQGTFTQKNSNTAEINFKQNSPFSLGGAFTYYPRAKLYSFSFSTYVSYLVASQNSLTSEKISIPPEIGGNLYGEYRLQKYNSILYSGLDYEKFSTLNLGAIQNDGKVYLDDVGVASLTVGTAKSFSMFDKQFFSKISASKSILSTYTSGAPQSSTITDHIDSGKYSGFRFMFYLNYKFSEKFYLHTLVKYTTMSGPSELSILRTGIGLGYILF
ncbi:MAG: hypothetical protein PHY93_17065 [Bacteriovorax sp.]|nr:hypothetical protein [Bacteriovorax sp.]